MKDKYKTLITACWIVLISCFIVKLLGGNWFEIACSNERFIQIFSWEYAYIIEFILSVIIYTLGTNMYMLSVLKTKMYSKQQIFMPISIFVLSIIKAIFYQYNLIMTALEIVIVILLPMILLKKKWYRSILAYLLMTIFQIISLLTKNFKIEFIDNNFILALIFSIDYYIMIALYYLYTIKEDNNNGKTWSFISRFRKRRND